MINRIGYCCINNTLAKSKIKVNRKMVLKKFRNLGLPGASSLALQNVTDMLHILQWNVDNNIPMYRMSSSIFPWMSEYELNQLPDYQEIKSVLAQFGQLAKDNNHRITFHPGHFTILASDNKSVVKKAIKELNQHSEIMDLIGLPDDHFSVINIHVGTTKGGKKRAINSFVKNFKKLNSVTQKRLTVENDDRQKMYDVNDLLEIHEKTNIPIVFDYHHHDCHPGKLSKKDALKTATSTWGNITPLVHFSSSKRIYEDSSSRDVAHADFIYDKINTYGLNLDVEIEAKAKELAVLDYFKKFKLNGTRKTN